MTANMKTSGFDTLLIGVLLALTACGGGAGGKTSAENGGNAQATTLAAYGTSPIGCTRMFVGGKPPAFADDRMSASTVPTCNRAYASLYSGVVRNPLWSAELLTKEGLDARRGIERVDDFHEDPRLPADRPTLRDYRASGWDRGHLAPDADMPSREAANESFALGSNIAPQDPDTNRHSWAELEKATRRQTRGGPVYIVTGTLYEGRLKATRDDGRVKVPTHFWKAIAATDRAGTMRGATVFVVTNGGGERWENLTVDQFAKIHHVDPFPGLEPRYRTANGATDGSMNRALEVGAKAAGGSASTGSGGDDRMVKSPLSGQLMPVESYRKQYNREPRPEEYTN